MQRKKGKIIAAVFCIIILTALFLFYGPIEQFRLLWINTAVYSSRFKFLATALYPSSYVESVLKKNEGAYQGKTETTGDTYNYGDDILFAEVKGNTYRGYLIKVADPRRINLAAAGNKNGKLLEDMVRESGAMGGINAGGYADAKARGGPWGLTIIDGQTVSAGGKNDTHVVCGLNRNYSLVVGALSEREMREQDYLWAVEFGPLLIVNGMKTALTNFSGGLSPRTAIGQTAEGHILLLVLDGRQVSSIGATFQDMQTVLYANGAINAFGLDGGSSSSMVYSGELINTPSGGDRERYLPNAILFY